MATSLPSGRLERALESRRHGQKSGEHSDDAGKADDNHQRGRPALGNASDIDAGDAIVWLNMFFDLPSLLEKRPAAVFRTSASYRRQKARLLPATPVMSHASSGPLPSGQRTSGAPTVPAAIRLQCS